MSRCPGLLAACLISIAGGCDRMPGAALPERMADAPAPDTFQSLYATNCAGCHGADGTHAPARALRDGAYMAAVDDAYLTRVIADGAGLMMPAFAASQGGALTPEQIQILVAGMRRGFAVPGVRVTMPGVFPGGGDVQRGQAAFASACASCHGNDSDGGEAGCVTSADFLRLVSDQALWTAVVFGRTDLGMPGAAGPFGQREAPLSLQEARDLVAYLASLRPNY